MSASPQEEQPRERGIRRFLLTILGGMSLAFCSFVAFFSLPKPYILEGVAAIIYAALFFTGVVLFFGGCIQAVQFLYRKIKGAS
jgi:hypothetical protein